MPKAPADFDAFWAARYALTLTVETEPVLRGGATNRDGWQQFDLRYATTDGIELGGWCLVPESGEVTRLFVVLHGYGGTEERL